MGKLLLDDKVFEDFEIALRKQLGVEEVKSKSTDFKSYLTSKYNTK